MLNQCDIKFNILGKGRKNRVLFHFSNCGKWLDRCLGWYINKFRIGLVLKRTINKFFLKIFCCDIKPQPKVSSFILHAVVRNELNHSRWCFDSASTHFPNQFGDNTIARGSNKIMTYSIRCQSGGALWSETTISFKTLFQSIWINAISAFLL